jgi:hypothetical protein
MLAMKAYERVEIELLSFLTTDIDGGEWSQPLHSREERPSYPLNSSLGGL